MLYLVHSAKYNGDQSTSTMDHYDIHDPLMPVLREHYTISNAYPLAIQKNILYAVQGNKMLFYAPEQKGKFTQMGSFDLPGSLAGMVVSDGLAYLALDRADMLILDVSNPAAPVEVSRYNGLGYTFVEDPKITPDPADTEPPSCESIYNDNTIGGAPGTILELSVPLVATDRQNRVDYMRYSYNAQRWSNWFPYQSPFTLVFNMPSNWASVGVSVQYRDSAGNVSQVCTWAQSTEGW